MAEYTPGPWTNAIAWATKDGKGTPGPNRAIIEGVDGVIMATAWGYSLPADECEANGRLIAAAPDLLAACEEFVHHLDYLVDVWGDEAITRNVREQANAAIAKAKGGGN